MSKHRGVSTPMDSKDAIQAIENIGGAEFLVKIAFRQNASWQGEIQWLNTGQKKCFRSFLELVMLMNQCLEKSGCTRSSYSFRSWENADETAGKSKHCLS